MSHQKSLGCSIQPLTALVRVQALLSNKFAGEINELNTLIYNAVNNGVYKAGFATTQQAYESAITPLFETLDWLDSHLAKHRYLVGDQITEADWRLFTTLVGSTQFIMVTSSAICGESLTIQIYPVMSVTCIKKRASAAP